MVLIGSCVHEVAKTSFFRPRKQAKTLDQHYRLFDSDSWKNRATHFPFHTVFVMKPVGFILIN